MRLIIGGYCQGKLNYATEKYLSDYIKSAEDDWKSSVIIEGRDLIKKDFSAMTELDSFDFRIINHLHDFIKEIDIVKSNEIENIMSLLDCLIEKNPDLILICDEVGYGIVPLDKTERIYRECVGRILCELVKRADSVERVVAGIGMILKE